MSLTIENVAPINLSVQQGTTSLRVFYGTTEITDILDDVFPETTALTNVKIIVTNDAGVDIDVQWDTSTPVPVCVRGETSKTLTMPDAGSCNSVNLTVWSLGTKHHDPVIRIKHKLGDVTPTCGPTPNP